MKSHEQDQLLELLKAFFSSIDINQRGITSKNKVAELLKQELTKKRRWKYLNRSSRPPDPPKYPY